MISSFADTIELKPAGANLWAGEADTNYSHPAGQFGGWTAAVLLKAAMMEPGERGLPLSLTVMFTDAIGAGPVEIGTRPLRTGARLQFWRAELSQRGKVCAHAQITFGARRLGTSFTDAKHWEMPAPDDPRMIAFSPPTKFGEQLDGRSLPWPPDYKPGEGPAFSVFWARHRQRLAVDHALLALLADFTPPRPMIKLGRFMLSSTVTMNIYFHASAEELAAVGTDYVLNETVSRRCDGGFFDHELKLWSRSGALLATSEQMAAFRE
jgi:acyl-CoA thioesterase